MPSRPRCGCTTRCSRSENPNDDSEGQDFTANLNPQSLEVLRGLQAGAGLWPTPRRAAATSSSAWATFCVDPDSAPGKPVFNRTVALRDTWAKIEKKLQMIIIGIGGILGDAASALLKDGQLAAAVEESKLSRRWPGSGRPGELPERSIAACLALAGANPGEGGLRGHRAPPAGGPRYPPAAALGLPQRTYRAGGAPARARRFRLLPLAFR